MGDIEYLKSNSRSKNVESISEWLGQEYVDKLKEWNKADWMLYKHFNATFTKKVTYTLLNNFLWVQPKKHV